MKPLLGHSKLGCEIARSDQLDNLILADVKLGTFQANNNE